MRPRVKKKVPRTVDASVIVRASMVARKVSVTFRERNTVIASTHRTVDRFGLVLEVARRVIVLASKVASAGL